MCVEHAIGMLKNYFFILDSHPFFSNEIQVDIVIVCCILHNYAMIAGGDELVLDEETWLA